MNICIISHEYPPNIISGLGTALVNLADGLKSNNKVTVITPLLRGGKEHEIDGNLEIIRLKIPNPRLLQKLNLIDPRILFSLKLSRFRKTFDFNRFDIIHVYDVHDSYFLSRKIHTPVLISVNDFYSYITPWNPLSFPYTTKHLPARYIHYNLTKILNKHFLKKSSHILVNTTHLKFILVEQCSINPASIFHIYRGIDPRRFSLASPDKYTSKNLLYTGSNMERKGVIYLIKALPEIFSKYPEASCTIIGKSTPGLMAQFNNILKKHNILNKVEFIPYVPSEKMPEYYSKANVFILPALFENLAVTILEAMASRTPVICTAEGANDEAIEHGKQGYIISQKSPEEIAHYVEKVFENPDKSRKMGRKGLEKINKKFPKHDMVSRVQELYKKILKEHGKVI